MAQVGWQTAFVLFAQEADKMLQTKGFALVALIGLLLAACTPAPTATLVPTATSTPTPMNTATPTIPPTPTLGIGSTKISADGATMVFVPAGEFTMGSNEQDDEKPLHTVSLDAFWIDIFEVTNALYRKCVDVGKCSAPNFFTLTGNPYYGDSNYDNYPVMYVPWEEAAKYCTFAKKQLPTEAQWEKATRGTDGRIYPWGNSFDANRLNSSEGGNGFTTAVGSYPNGASPYGAMDMAGNVWEWVADWYDANYYKNSPSRNPKNETPATDRVVRGGSFLSTDSTVRAAIRNDFPPGVWGYFVGVRCAQ